ncbi:MAG: hypothetical protein ABSC05_26350 [Candidatus Solibacter sp.]|jgi:transposase InsO family protein
MGCCGCISKRSWLRGDGSDNGWNVTEGMPFQSRPNQEWLIDLVSDALANGRAIRALTVLDNFTKVAPAIDVDTSLSRGCWIV